MTWAPPPGGVASSGLPATAEPDTDPDMRRRPDRPECELRAAKHCDGQQPVPDPGPNISRGLGYFVPEGHRAYGWASLYIDPSAARRGKPLSGLAAAWPTGSATPRSGG